MVSGLASRSPVTALLGATAFICLVVFAGACSTNPTVVSAAPTSLPVSDSGEAGYPGTPRQYLEAEFMAQCMTEHGFPPIRDGIALGFPSADEQDEVFSDALTGCTELADAELPPFDPPQGVAYYEAVKEVADCLTAAGFTVSEAPTLEVFPRVGELGRGAMASLFGSAS